MHEDDIKSVEEFFNHGEEKLPDYEWIICTEKGTIAFINQTDCTCCEMGYGGYIGEGFTIMQYCTEHLNKWTKKVLWMADDYWKSISKGYQIINP